MSLNLSRAIDEVIHGMRMAPEPEPMTGFVEGEVVAVSAAGLTFTVKNWDGGKNKFGPCPWPMSRTEPNHSPGILAGVTALTGYSGTNLNHDHGPHTHADHDHNETKPVKGDRCLAVFTDNGPWVIGWWPA